MRYCVTAYTQACGYLQLLVNYKKQAKVQHAAMVPAFVAMRFVPRRRGYVKTCMFEGLEYNLWEHLLPCLVDYSYVVMQRARQHCNEKPGARSISTCLFGIRSGLHVNIDNSSYTCAGCWTKAGCCSARHPGCSCQHSPSPFPQAQASAYRCPGHTHKAALLPVKFMLSLHLLCAALHC